MKTLLSKLASTRLTFTLLVVLAVTVWVTHDQTAGSSWSIVAPMALLGLNLVAALLTHPRLRQGGLLLLHVALLGVLLLVGIGRLTHFDGRIEITEGNQFNVADVEVLGRGVWHNDRLADVRFVQGPFLVDYAPGLRRGHTTSFVQMTDRENNLQSSLVGDDQ
ncbi:MAG: cytochrome c biogenesis protein ResB, partial [Burkholderiales bacterium]|nr:cytochrome c biogenesis protein ResB [Burkholderiales bacterium]